MNQIAELTSVHLFDPAIRVGTLQEFLNRRPRHREFSHIRCPAVRRIFGTSFSASCLFRQPSGSVYDQPGPHCCITASHSALSVMEMIIVCHNFLRNHPPSLTGSKRIIRLTSEPASSLSFARNVLIFKPSCWLYIIKFSTIVNRKHRKYFNLCDATNLQTIFNTAIPNCMDSDTIAHLSRRARHRRIRRVRQLSASSRQPLSPVS